MQIVFSSLIYHLDYSTASNLNQVEHIYSKQIVNKPFLVLAEVVGKRIQSFLVKIRPGSSQSSKVWYDWLDGADFWTFSTENLPRWWWWCSAIVFVFCLSFVVIWSFTPTPSKVSTVARQHWKLHNKPKFLRNKTHPKRFQNPKLFHLSCIITRVAIFFSNHISQDFFFKIRYFWRHWFKVLAFVLYDMNSYIMPNALADDKILLAHLNSRNENNKTRFLRSAHFFSVQKRNIFFCLG